MSRSYRPRVAFNAWLFLAIVTAGCGVTPAVVEQHSEAPPRKVGLEFPVGDGIAEIPHELKKVTPPPYVIEPPDVLIIDAIRLVPRPPYKIEPFDALGVQVTNTLPNAPIAGVYSVDPGGTINLGYTYGTVQVIGQTLEQAKITVEQHLKQKLKPPYEVTVILAEYRAMQLLRGEHLVHPDGTVSLGNYGSVLVDGLTIPEAKVAVETQLSNFLVKPQISVDVAGFNSRVYYVIIDNGGAGETVVRLPSTGKESVLDAVGMVGGLSPVISKQRIWVARPAPSNLGCVQTLAVDWVGISQRGETATNYQLMPGDRLYMKAAPFVTIDTYLARFISPIERCMGITLLTSSLYQSLRGTNGTNGTP